MRNRLAGIGYARAAGIAVGVFLIVWAPLNSMRWAGSGPETLIQFQYLFYPAYGILLAMPWKKLPSEGAFRFFYGILLIFSLAFVFTQVLDLMFQYPINLEPGAGRDETSAESIYVLTAEKGEKPAPPAFQGALVFLAILQVPAVLFARKPQLLD